MEFAVASPCNNADIVRLSRAHALEDFVEGRIGIGAGKPSSEGDVVTVCDILTPQDCEFSDGGCSSGKSRVEIRG